MTNSTQPIPNTSPSPRQLLQAQKEQPTPIKNQNKSSWEIYCKFLGYAKKRWKLGLFVLLITILSGISYIAFPLIIGRLLDTVTKQINIQSSSLSSDTFSFREQFKNYAIILFIVTIMIAATTFFRFLSMTIFQEKLCLDLKKQICQLFMKNDINFFETYKNGQLISRLTNDINLVKSVISNNVSFLIRNLITIIGSIVVMFVISWKLSLCVFSIIPVYAFITIHFTNKAKKLVKQSQDIQAEISAFLGERFSGIQIIKACNTEDLQIKNYMNANYQCYGVNKRRALYQAFYSAWGTILPSFGAFFVLIYAGQQLLTGHCELTAGQLACFILYCSSMSVNTVGISNSLSSIVNSTGAITKVFEMMEYKKLINQDEGAKVQINGSVQFSNVQFKYPKASSPILSDMSLKITSGSFVGFVGQSGSGKSTITKLIQHFYGIQKGSIFFGNHNSKDINIKHLRDQISYVGQQPIIFSGTVQENIAYGMSDYSVQDMHKVAQKAGCLQFLSNKVLFPNGFQTVLGERAANLSGGQKQRISIARALMKKPKIIIFDEATSALDSHSEHVIQQTIENLSQNKSMTIIVISHRLSTVIKCNKLFVMKQGKIIETGTHEQLIRQNGYYSHLFQKQLYHKKKQSDSEENSQNQKTLSNF